MLSKIVSSRIKDAILLIALLLFFFALFLFSGVARAQVSPIPFLKPQWFNNSGQPCSGCLLNTYIAGTTTPQQTFFDAAGLFPNTNPVVLDATGRAFVFLSANSYKFVMTTAGGTVLWSIDNITASNLSLLASNNTWTGTNTFNAATIFNGSATFNVGLTSLGPNILGGGGSLAGTFSGSPIFSGTPNFSAGFLATTGSFSGQITSTLTTGTPPFIIASTTNVANLNAASVNGCTFAIPCSLGSTTPNSVFATTLNASTSFVLNGGTAQTGTQGTDTKLLTAGTIGAGAGHSVCTDANSGVTTVGCVSGPAVVQDVTVCAAGCTITGTICTTSGAGSASCTSGPFTWPIAFADTAYILVCQGVTATNFPYIGSQTKTNSTFSVVIYNGTASSALASTYAEIDCHAAHN